MNNRKRTHIRIRSRRLITLEQFSPPGAIYPELTIWGVMERFAELIRRFLEIQSDGPARSPELIAEDDRLMDGLQKRYRAFVLGWVGEQ